MSRNIIEGRRAFIPQDRLRGEAEAALGEVDSHFPRYMASTLPEQEAYLRIVAEYPKSYLTDHQREFIGQLARVMVRLDQEMMALADEDSVIRTHKEMRGSKGYDQLTLNPRFQAMNTLISLAQKMRRSLGLSLELLGGGSRKEGAGVQTRESQMMHGLLDDLIARPGLPAPPQKLQ